MTSCRWLSIFTVLAFLCAPALPQASTSTVRGSVQDQSGAVVPSAEVSLTHTTQGVTSRAKTNDAGMYILPGVVPGPYKLTIEAAGMQKYEATLTVQVQQVAVVDAVLKVGQTATEVRVEDVTPMVTVDNPTLGHVLERQRIEQLPINGRSILNLLQTVPGLDGESGFRAYGTREGSQEFVLDGSAMTDRLWGGAQRRPPGLDTIQEFKVETNNSSAKFTRPTSIIMSTKSGTNELHGSLFETHRNNAIGKARQRQEFFDKPPQLIRNEFGGSVGGPVYLPKLYNGRNRTFWFFAYEGFRNINPTTKGFQVPTEAMRNGDFRGLVDSAGRQIRIYDPLTTNPDTWQRQQFSYQGQANVIDPARINPLAKHLYSITPLPTLPNVNPLVENNWFGPVANTRRQWTVTTRFDHRFSDSDSIYGRYTQGDHYVFRDFFSLPALDGVASTQTDTAPNKSLALNYLRTFSPTFFNELMVSGSREHWRTATGGPEKYSDQLGLPNPFGVNGWPGLYDTGLSTLFYETQNTTETAFNSLIIDDNATKIMGRHELQFGFHYRYDQLNALPEQQQNQGNHNWNTSATALYDPATPRNSPQATPLTGHNLANMFLGVMNYSNQFVRGYFYMRSREYSLYLQDNFKITPRLTLNMGLRWEYWPAYREKNNVLVSFDPQRRAIVLGQNLQTLINLGATIQSIPQRLESLGAKFVTAEEAGFPSGLMKSNFKDFGPRLGFAYRAGDGAKSFVIRGGYRISYFPVPLSTWTQRMRQNAPLNARFTLNLNDAAQTPDGLPSYLLRTVPTVFAGVNSRNVIQLSDAGRLTRGSNVVSYFDVSQPDSRIQDWNLTIEKEVMANTVARVAYIGNHGSNLDQYYRFNEPTPDYLWFVTRGERLPTGEFANVARRPYDQTVYGTIERYQKTGWSNFNGVQLELERRYSRGYGFQLFYVLSNAFASGGRGWTGAIIPELNQFLPGAVPTDLEERNRFLNYQRDIDIPKHRVRWNWIADLPFGKGRRFGGNAGGFLDRLIGHWQVAGIGQLRSNYFTLPTGTYPTGNPIELYGEKYRIEDCRSGQCRPGYLWWNGYIPAHQINSVDAQGRPNGIMGVPENYKPATAPLIPWPRNPNPSDPNYSLFGTNTVFVPLKDGTLQRTTFNDGLHPWRQQYLPGPRQWGLDASLFKAIPINERVMVRFNADFFNVLNRPGNPNTITGDGLLSTFTSGQSARELQLTLRLIW